MGCPAPEGSARNASPSSRGSWRCSPRRASSRPSPPTTDQPRAASHRGGPLLPQRKEPTMSIATKDRVCFPPGSLRVSHNDERVDIGLSGLADALDEIVSSQTIEWLVAHESDLRRYAEISFV